MPITWKRFFFLSVRLCCVDLLRERRFPFCLVLTQSIAHFFFVNPLNSIEYKRLDLFYFTTGLPFFNVGQVGRVVFLFRINKVLFLVTKKRSLSLRITRSSFFLLGSLFFFVAFFKDTLELIVIII